MLITWDVDANLWLKPERRRADLDLALDVCRQYDIRATFFITARPADLYADKFKGMLARGHEIGCHGLTHGDEENYDRMPQDMQQAYIQEATTRLQALAGAPIRAFRGPRVKISACTMEILAACGYWADSSVCSQRADLVSSNLLNTDWLLSPRLPYHPHPHNPFKRGDVPLWEIPVSAAVIPFISASMQVLGLSAMKAFFRLLYAESQKSGKPIVYLAHPNEFATVGSRRLTKRLKRHLKPEYFTLAYIRAHGLRVRNLLFRVPAETLFRYTHELFAYIASFPAVKFTTVSEYVAGHLESGMNQPGGRK